MYGIIANDAHLLLKCKYANVKLRLFQKKKLCTIWWQIKVAGLRDTSANIHYKYV